MSQLSLRGLVVNLGAGAGLLMVVILSEAHAQIGNVVLAVHGGIGAAKAEVDPSLDRALRADLERALRAGAAALAGPHANCLDGVEAAVRVLEDSPHFNAGHGSVFTHEGQVELDAAIMYGKTKEAGSIAGVRTVRNPIVAARAVMQQSPHVMLIGPAADSFAQRAGLEIVDPEYFWTAARWQQLQRQLEAERAAGPTGADPAGNIPAQPARSPRTTQTQGAADSRREWGTVGAVAVDAQGNLAAGTSTGGMSNKRPGRVGDTPIIGAGTYADNDGCAVSCTGHGEYFIRFAVAHELTARMKYLHENVQQSADVVVQKVLRTASGEGGLIALDPHGNCAFSFNTAGLYRGYITRDGKVRVMLWDE